MLQTSSLPKRRVDTGPALPALQSQMRTLPSDEAEYNGAMGRRRGRTASSLFRRQATLGQQYAALLPLLLAAGDPLKQGLDRHAPRQSAAIRGDLWEDCQPLLRAAATVAAVRVELIKLYGRLAQLATTDAPAAV